MIPFNTQSNCLQDLSNIYPSKRKLNTSQQKHFHKKVKTIDKGQIHTLIKKLDHQYNTLSTSNTLPTSNNSSHIHSQLFLQIQNDITKLQSFHSSFQKLQTIIPIHNIPNHFKLKISHQHPHHPKPNNHNKQHNTRKYILQQYDREMQSEYYRQMDADDQNQKTRKRRVSKKPYWMRHSIIG